MSWHLGPSWVNQMSPKCQLISNPVTRCQGLSFLCFVVDGLLKIMWKCQRTGIFSICGKLADAWKVKRREEGHGRRDQRGEDETEGGQRERERVALLSFSGTRPCHLTPATEWARIPCPLGRKLRPANRNSKEGCMQIPTAKGNGCP